MKEFIILLFILLQIQLDRWKKIAMTETYTQYSTHEKLQIKSFSFGIKQTKRNIEEQEEQKKHWQHQAAINMNAYYIHIH